MEEPEPVSSDSYTGRYYEEDCGGAEFFKAYGPAVLKPVLALCLKRAGLKPGMTVLDIGCGRGELLFQARRAGAWGAGTDFARPALALAAKTSGAPMVLCDAKALPFAAGAFDRVFFVGVMDHLHDWELERCFAEMARVLKPGGCVLIHTCANRLYYKNLTYGARRKAAGLLRALGLPVGAPRAPRSAQDEALHVNEHTLAGMRDFFRRIGWKAEVEARPNEKLAVRDLYGEALPEGFPLKPAPGWKAWLYKAFVFRGPLKAYLAREFFAVARPSM